MLKSALVKASNLYNEYPRNFWIVVLVTFIDRVGGALIFPFFALYLTSKFNVSMTDVGVLFATFSLSSFAGSTRWRWALHLRLNSSSCWPFSSVF